MDIQVITDSTSNISQELAEKHGIRVIPLSFTFGESHIRETEIENEEFYRLMEEKGCIPKSSQPPIQEFINIFSEYVGKGKKILGIFISKEMSGTFSTARLAASMVAESHSDCEIEILDSKTNCMEMGYAAIRAAECAREGKSMDKTKEEAGNVLNSSRFLFAPKNLTYLRKGGRIGGAQALVGNMLKINPILTVNDEGKADIFDKVRTQKKAIKRIVEVFKNETESFGLRNVTVHHINAISEAESLAEMVRGIIGHAPQIMSIGPIIGLHVGPGTVGVAYATEKEIRKR